MRLQQRIGQGIGAYDFRYIGFGSKPRHRAIGKDAMRTGNPHSSCTAAAQMLEQFQNGAATGHFIVKNNDVAAPHIPDYR